MHAPALTFEKNAAVAARGGLHACALVLVCWGIGTLLAGGIPVVKASGAAGLALGLALYVYLWRAAPQARYFVYCRIDGAGLHHIEGNDPADRMSHFAWHEIERVALPDAGDDFRGIVLYLRRAGMRGVPVRLAMEHGAEAAAAIRAHLALPLEAGTG